MISTGWGVLMSELVRNNMKRIMTRSFGINVLLATDASLERGGITLFMLQWIRGIKEANTNTNIHVYFREHIEDEYIAHQYEKLGVCIHTGNIQPGVSFKNTAARKKTVNDIKKLLSKESFDVIHINSGIFGFTAALLNEAQLRGVPIRIAHSHGAYRETAIDKVVHQFLRLRINKLATVYAGCSKKAGAYLFGTKGISSPKWKYIPNAIQVNRFVFDNTKRIEYRKAIDVHENEILLGAIGHLYIGKNHTFLIDVVKGLRDNDIPAKLIIIGQGDQKKALCEKILQYNLQRYVIMYGGSDDVPGWLSAMDIFLMPSTSEGLGISAIEAQASGLPCLLSDRFPEEAVIGKNVWCLPINKGVNGWVNRIQKLIAGSESNRSLGAKIVATAGFDQRDTVKYVRLLYGI